MSVLDDLATLLATNGFGTPAVSLFKGGIPTDPPPHITVQDDVIGLETVPGLPMIRGHDGLTYQQPVVKMSCRGTPYGYEAAFTRAEAIQTLLEAMTNVVIGGHFYLWIVPMQAPWRERVDDYHRPVLVFNVRCAMRTS